MADPKDANNVTLLERLYKLANIDPSAANSHSIRSWLISAKRCFDQVSPFSSRINPYLLGAGGRNRK
jgi:hypothetical protein